METRPKEPDRIRVLLAGPSIRGDDNLGDGLYAIGCEPCGVATCDREALALASESQADVVLLDAHLCDHEQLVTLATQLRERNGSAIIFVADEHDDACHDMALRARPHGLIRRPIEPRDLKICIDLSLVQRHRERQLQGLLAHLQNEEKRLRTVNNALIDLSSRDPLTQLANRRALDGALTREWRRQRREHQPLAVVMIDVDDFKAYNDHYGHPAGDTTLQRIACILKSACQRPGDIACRYGGEEFMLILPDTDHTQAKYIADQIRSNVEALNIPHERASATKRVTISAGIAVAYPDADTSPDHLMACADTALYRAKHNGRNTVCH